MTSHTHPFNFRHFVAVGLLAWMTAAAPAWAATVVSSYKGNGASAWLGVQQSDCLWLYLSVGRNDAPEGRTTYVWFDMYNFCTNEYSYGYGQIPNASFKISGKTSRLIVDPAATPGVQTYGAVGRIDVTWTTDRSIRELYDGRWETITPTQRIRSRGNSDSYAAAAKGTLLGHSIATNGARVGTSRGTYVEVVR